MAVTPLEAWIAGKMGLEPGTVSLEAIERYQLAKIRETLSRAQEGSAFYREALAGVHPSDIVDFTQVSKLPFTYPQDVRDNPLRFVCARPSDIERIVTLRTSGTTGDPKRLYFTKKDQELTIDFFDYGMRNLVDSSDRVLILLPWQTPGSVGDLLRIGLERLGACPLPYGIVSDPEDALAAALSQRATSMVGIPTQVLSMARHGGGEQLAGRIRGVLLSTDHVPNAICRALEERWGCQVYNHYGMTEMGLGGGVQCHALKGYHLREADLYVEIVNSRSGQPLPAGELGEVVFTTLTRQGMPLIRYRTGDISRFLPEPCPCGTVLRSLDIVRRRVSDQVWLAGAGLSLTELDEALFALDGVVNFRCTLTSAGEKDRLTVDLKMADGVPIDHAAVSRSIDVVPAIRAGVAAGTLEVVVSEPRELLPISQGTAKRTIIDLRETGHPRAGAVS